MDKKQKANLKALIEKLPSKELRKNILKKGQTDTDFYVALTKQYGDLDEQAELAETKRQIDLVFSKKPDVLYLSSSQLSKYIKLLNQILRKYKVRLEEGHYRHALDGFLLVLQAISEVIASIEIEDPVYTLFDRLVEALHLFSRQVSKTTAAERTGYIKEIESAVESANFSDFDDWRYTILMSILPMLTEQGAKLIEADFRQTHSDSTAYQAMSNGDYQFRTNLVLKVHMLFQLKHKDKAEALMDQNKNIPEIQELQIQLAINNQDFDVAEKEALNAVKMAKENQYYPTLWRHYLIKIYKLTHQRQKLEGVYRDELLEDQDLNAYFMLKQMLVEDGLWNQEYAKLLPKVKQVLPIDAYLEILNDGQKIQKMMAIIDADPSWLTIKFAKTLYQKYPDKINELFYQQFILAEKNVNRAAYRRMAKSFSAYISFGDVKLAKVWIHQLINNYPHRRAMIDELTAVLKEIRKIES